MQCWSVCHCECTRNAFPLRSYILCKQEKYKSFLMSDHSHFLLWCSVQAEWGLSIKDRTPDPELCRPGGEALARAVALCPKWERGHTVAYFILPAFFSFILKCRKRIQLHIIAARSEKYCRPVNCPAKPAIPYLGQKSKIKVYSLGDKSFRRLLRQGRREQAECPECPVLRDK